MVLITGASGLLGQHVLAWLSQQGIPVRAMYHSVIPTLYTEINTAQVEWVKGDILDIQDLMDAMTDVHQVYHCAAMVSYDARKAQQMRDVNVMGTANVVNVCLDHPGVKLLFVSSIAAIGKERPGIAASEKTPWDEHAELSNYAVSKFDAEMEIWRGIAEGLNAVIINPAIILGEGDQGKSSSNLIHIVRKEFPYYTDGGTAWVDAKDVAAIMHLLMNSNVSAERFIVSAENLRFREVFTAMAHAMKVKPPHRYASPAMTAWVWRWYYWKSLITGKTATLTRETARAAHEVSLYDASKFLQRFPSFRYTPISETINRICKP